MANPLPRAQKRCNISEDFGVQATSTDISGLYIWWIIDDIEQRSSGNKHQQPIGNCESFSCIVSVELLGPRTNVTNNLSWHQHPMTTTLTYVDRRLDYRYCLVKGQLFSNYYFTTWYIRKWGREQVESLYQWVLHEWLKVLRQRYLRNWNPWNWILLPYHKSHPR